MFAIACLVYGSYLIATCLSIKLNIIATKLINVGFMLLLIHPYDFWDIEDMGFR